MKRIALDTNVLVSGVLSLVGPPGAIVGLVLDGQLGVVCSDAILEEYRDVLARPGFGLEPREVETLLDQITAGGLLISPPPWPQILPDPDDGHFLATAKAVSCPLVTGNLKHYPRSRMGVRVMTPREFINSGV